MSLNSAFLARAGATVLAVAAFTVASGAAAQAHVTVIPESTASGSFTKLTFRVPNESDTASTASLVVSLPTDTPLIYVTARQLDGWTVKITKAKLAKPVERDGATITEAVSKVTWTANKGSEIAPGQFQEFALSGGPLPAGAKALSFPAVQTYTDGKVVSWDQPQAEGAEEPEHPVPSFALTAAAPEGGHGAAAADTTSTTTVAATTAKDASDGTARVFGLGGLLVGLLGLAFGVLAWRKAGTRA
jgi:periplasmic copper chaperone A